MNVANVGPLKLPLRAPEVAILAPGRAPVGQTRGMDREVGQLYSVARAVLDPLFSFLWRIEVEGLRERARARAAPSWPPTTCRCSTTSCWPPALPRRITYVGKAEYMDRLEDEVHLPGPGHDPDRPRRRLGGQPGARSRRPGCCSQGELFGIYPEGTRSRDGKLHKGHTGVARLAMRTGCPIIPVGLQGTLEVQQPDSRMPKPFKVMRVRFGRPLPDGPLR